MNRNIYLFAIAIIIIVASCATGTALVTGIQRPATNPENVIIYTEIPSCKYETIGIVTASSDAGWTEQDDLNYAVAELKRQAAKIGANGVILDNISTSNSGGVISNGIIIPVTAKNVSGKAIYIPDKGE